MEQMPERQGVSLSGSFTRCREPGSGHPYLIITVQAFVTDEIDFIGHGTHTSRNTVLIPSGDNYLYLKITSLKLDK